MCTRRVCQGKHVEVQGQLTRVDLSLYPVFLWDQTHAIGLSRGPLYPLRHLAGPIPPRVVVV